MRRSSIILTWVLLFLLQTFFGLMYLGMGSIGCRCYHPDFEIVFTAENFVIYTDSESDQAAIDQIWDESSPMEIEHYQRIYARPEVKHGPVDGLIEFYETSWYLESPDEVWIHDPRFDTPFWRTRVHTKLVSMAKQNPQLAQFRPGSPGQTSFDADAAIGTLIRLVIYFGIPTLAVWIIYQVKRRSTELSAEWRRSEGLCVHCLYDCTDLTTPICPECGHIHAQATSA